MFGNSFSMSFQLLSISLQLNLTIFVAWGKWSIDVLFYSPSKSPPGVYVLLYLQVENLFIGVIMVLVYFIRVFFVWDLVFEVEVRIRSPCFLTKICKKDRISLNL